MFLPLIKWGVIMLINLLGFLTAPIIFPIAYLLRDIKLFRNYILWIYYDDEDDFGFNVSWWMRDKKPSFWMAYKWCAIRNPAWNLHTLFIIAPKIENYNYLDFIIIKEKGIIQKNHKIIKPNLYNTCVLKFVNDSLEYTDNIGDWLSLKYSIIGKSFIIFYYKGNKYFRFSYANKVFLNFWIELQLGYTTRATFRFKIKNVKKIY